MFFPAWTVSRPAGPRVRFPMPFDQTDSPLRDAYTPETLLPEPLPADPFPLFRDWFEEARDRRVQPNPNAMTLATPHADGSVSARIVLCKHLVVDPGWVVFFTNYHGRKGRALAETARAAAVLHWDLLDRQVRLEGPVVRSPGEESDAYFASRRLESRLGAHASDQSEPIGSRAELLAKVEETARRFGLDPSRPLDEQQADIPRPPHWGGYRLIPERLELWAGGPGRVHDRAVWTRSVVVDAGSGGLADSGMWQATRLQP